MMPCREKDEVEAGKRTHLSLSLLLFTRNRIQYTRMGIITHIVSFKYKESATSAERHLVASSFLALQSRCVDESGKSYIAVTGGKDNSPEGMSNGYDVSSLDLESCSSVNEIDSFWACETRNSILLS